MKKSILWVIGLLFSASLAVTSCNDTEGVVDPYFNWQERNELYIDSIAQVARANLGNEVGQWKTVHTYKFNPSLNDLNPDPTDYVYCRVIEKGTGTVKPIYTDSVTTHYRGKLIQLYDGSKVVFDQSFQGELNDEIAVPIGFGVGSVIEGWTSVLQQMVVGDRWEVHIPWRLGYGAMGSSSIPGYSTLIFDMKLVEVYTNR